MNLYREIKKGQLLWRSWYKLLSAYYERRYGKALVAKEDLQEIIARNRKTLSSVDKWVQEDACGMANYQLTKGVKEIFNHKALNHEIIHSDILCYLTAKLSKPVQYLELGVSAGRNFFLLANYLSGAKLTGFDIEEINPPLESMFAEKAVQDTWEAPAASAKEGTSSLSTYRYKTNKIAYLSGDAYAESSWERLSGEKFNFIFSDSYHVPSMIAFEYEMIKKYDLLDAENFVFYWDDLGGVMSAMFMTICKDICARYAVDPQHIVLNRYNGWLGQHEKPHLNGIIYKV